MLSPSLAPSALPASWYQRQGAVRLYASAYGSYAADVCVIGGGIMGLSVALALAKTRSVILLEAHQIGAGASGRNGGQILPGFALPEEDLVAKLGAYAAQKAWCMTRSSQQALQRLALEHEIAYQPGVLVAAPDKTGLVSLKKRAKFWQDVGQQVHLLEADDTHSITKAQGYVGGLLDPGSGSLDPYALMQAMAFQAQAAGVQIFEKSAVLRAEHGNITGIGFEVLAPEVVWAVNTHLKHWKPSKTQKAHTFMMAMPASCPEDLPTMAVYDTGFGMHYFRAQGDHLVFGSGTSPVLMPQALQKAWLYASVRRRMPAFKPQTASRVWSGPLDVTSDLMPVLGKDHHRLQRTWWAEGFCGHGMALAHCAGSAVAEAVLGKEDAFSFLSRLSSHAAPSLCKAAWLRLGHKAFG